MRRYQIAALAVGAFLLLSTHPSLAVDQRIDPPTPSFDIGPAIDQALTIELNSAIEESVRLGEQSRRIAAALLATPVVTGPNGPQTASEESLPTARKPGEWLVGGFDRSSRWATLGIGVALAAYLGTADDDDIAELGDITQFLPLAAGLGRSIGVGDWEGVRQLGLAGGTSFVLTHGIKELTSKMRPDATSANSFPSGHTSASGIFGNPCIFAP